MNAVVPCQPVAAEPAEELPAAVIDEDGGQYQANQQQSEVGTAVWARIFHRLASEGVSIVYSYSQTGGIGSRAILWK